MRPSQLKTLKSEGKTCVMAWVGFDSPYLAEVLGSIGYNAVLIDCQHGMIGLEKGVAMMQAVSSTQATPLLRVYHNSLGDINKALDSGAFGIICPLINNAEEAERFGLACRYPTGQFDGKNGKKGQRSYGPARGVTYGGADYFANANDTIMALAMIETPDGLANVDAIARAQGVDGLFVGPGDLGLAIGLAPTGTDYKNGPLAEAIAKVLAACRAAGKYAGIWCSDVVMAKHFAGLGWDMVVPGTDSMWLRAAATKNLTEMRV